MTVALREEETCSNASSKRLYFSDAAWKGALKVWQMDTNCFLNFIWQFRFDFVSYRNQTRFLRRNDQHNDGFFWFMKFSLIAIATQGSWKLSTSFKQRLILSFLMRIKSFTCYMILLSFCNWNYVPKEEKLRERISWYMLKHPKILSPTLARSFWFQFTAQVRCLERITP